MPDTVSAARTSRRAPQDSAPVAARYQAVRAHTEALCASLAPEDQCVQSMPDASPAKWHRAHTTWFFEEFVLAPHAPGYRPCDPAFRYLFNSYYETVGARHPRPFRGLITRPSAEAVGAYRAHVDAAMAKLLEAADPAVAHLVTLGLHHEQQHQELLMTDMVHAFAQSPLSPAMLPGWTEPPAVAGPARMLAVEGGIVRVGASDGFAFDSELPRHDALIHPFRIADRLVRNGEFLEFIEDGGYAMPTLWMSEGWAAAQAEGWSAPLYWRKGEDCWTQMGPGGLAPLDRAAPVRQVSWYEADAYARWASARLPTEQEWEAASSDARVLEQTGHVWQWTSSAYGPYPGFLAAPGALGEYNGKFMVNQMVLRGGSMATPAGHTRASYRNFFHPDKRWQFAGIRLAANS